MDELPGWIQEIGIIATAIVAIFIGICRYAQAQADHDKEATPPNGSQVVAASFVDSRLLREMIDALREHQEENARIATRVIRSNTELREAIIEASENSKLLCDTQLNLLKFLKRET